MTAVSISDDVLARVRKLLEKEQPHLTLPAACKAFNDTIGTPLESFDRPIEVRAEDGMLWGTLYGIFAGLVIFENTGKFGVLRRTKTSGTEIIFVVTWLTKVSQWLEGVSPLQQRSAPAIIWSHSETKVICVTEAKCLFLSAPVWTATKEWLDGLLPVPVE